MSLAQLYPQVRVIIAGGGAEHAGEAVVTESDISRDILVSMGLPAARIALEKSSRNTCEDAAQNKCVAAPAAGQNWLVVTSASHMPRAIGCFRAAEFAVTPYPVDYRTRGRQDYTRLATTVATGLGMIDLAAHEWVGRISYRLTGRTKELFPSP